MAFLVYQWHFCSGSTTHTVTCHMGTPASIGCLSGAFSIARFQSVNEFRYSVLRYCTRTASLDRLSEQTPLWTIAVANMILLDIPVARWTSYMGLARVLATLVQRKPPVPATPGSSSRSQSSRPREILQLCVIQFFIIAVTGQLWSWVIPVVAIWQTKSAVLAAAVAWWVLLLPSAARRAAT